MKKEEIKAKKYYSKCRIYWYFACIITVPLFRFFIKFLVRWEIEIDKITLAMIIVSVIIWTYELFTYFERKSSYVELWENTIKVSNWTEIKYKNIDVIIASQFSFWNITWIYIIPVFMLLFLFDSDADDILVGLFIVLIIFIFHTCPILFFRYKKPCRNIICKVKDWKTYKFNTLRNYNDFMKEIEDKWVICSREMSWFKRIFLYIKWEIKNK
jgi:hypothetical protein